jgi:ubiquinone biosynthesis protein COQ9
MASSIHSRDTQDQIIRCMIDFVPTYGWTLSALEKAVVLVGYKKQDALRAFEGEMDKALLHFIHLTNQEMLAQLKEEDLTPLRTHERLAKLIMARLKVLSPYRAALPKILLYQAHPLRHFKTLQRLFEIVSEIWYAAGDRSTDFNYYSKRFLLSAVYTSTFFYWLKDPSPDFDHTQDFLSQRLNNVMQIPVIKKKIKEKLQHISLFFKK